MPKSLPGPKDMPEGHPDLPTDLTIGLPVYNMEAYVEEAVQSLLSQTYSNFRLVISDNASTDGTTEILARLAQQDTRITLIEQFENKGIAANFRAVLDACQTPYFMWAAADDVWQDNWIERLLPIAKRQDTIAFGQTQDVDQSLRKRSHPANGRDLSFSGPRLIRRLRYFLSPGLLGRANPIYGIFRKELLDEAAWAEFASGKLYGDVLLLYVMLRRAEIICDPGGVIYKRRHPKSAAVSGGPQKAKRRFRKTHLPDIWRLSSWDERVGLILLYPVAAIRAFAAKLAYLKGRALSRGRTY